MNQFDEDLLAIFEDRAQDLSPSLRMLLKKLWSEGVKHGRNLERDRGHRQTAETSSFARHEALLHDLKTQKMTVALEDIETAATRLSSISTLQGRRSGKSLNTFLHHTIHDSANMVPPRNLSDLAFHGSSLGSHWYSAIDFGEAEKKIGALLQTEYLGDWYVGDSVVVASASPHKDRDEP